LAKNGSSETVAVIGLGRFGQAVAEALLELGHDVIGIDADAHRVQELATILPHVVQADCTNAKAIEDLGIAEVDHAVVAIGSDLEASVMTVMALTEAGVRDIWAKALTARHGAILTRLGVHHVSFPEADQGRRIAHLINGQLHDFLMLSDDFAVASMLVPANLVGRPLVDLGIRAKHGITIIGFKSSGQPFQYATPETVLPDGVEIIVSGHVSAVRSFSGEFAS